MFRYMGSLPIPEDRQRHIYELCLRYDELPAGIRRRLRENAGRAAREYADALAEVVFFGRPFRETCRKYYLSRATLNRCVRRFYKDFPPDL